MACYSNVLKSQIKALDSTHKLTYFDPFVTEQFLFAAFDDRTGTGQIAMKDYTKHISVLAPRAFYKTNSRMIIILKQNLNQVFQQPLNQLWPVFLKI